MDIDLLTIEVTFNHGGKYYVQKILFSVSCDGCVHLH
jgi:hypothetical protein